MYWRRIVAASNIDNNWLCVDDIWARTKNSSAKKTSIILKSSALVLQKTQQPHLKEKWPKLTQLSATATRYFPADDTETSERHYSSFCR